MIDLTRNLINAIKLNELWEIDGFHICKENFQQHGYKILFWENEENWATILTDCDETVGYLWRKNPLLILNNIDNYFVSNLLYPNKKIEILIRENFLDKVFYIKDKELVDKIFQCCLNMPFSIDDLWFYTNSI